MSGQIAKMISSKMPGGFGPAAIKAHLASRFHLAESTVDGVLVQAVSSQPANRLQTGKKDDRETDTQTVERLRR